MLSAMIAYACICYVNVTKSLQLQLEASHRPHKMKRQGAKSDGPGVVPRSRPWTAPPPCLKLQSTHWCAPMLRFSSRWAGSMSCTHCDHCIVHVYATCFWRRSANILETCCAVLLQVFRDLIALFSNLSCYCLNRLIKLERQKQNNNRTWLITHPKARPSCAFIEKMLKLAGACWRAFLNNSLLFCSGFNVQLLLEGVQHCGILFCIDRILQRGALWFPANSPRAKRQIQHKEGQRRKHQKL